MKTNITYRRLGPLETGIVARLTYEKKSIVTASDLDELFNLSPEDRKQIVYRLKKKKILLPIKRGVYLFSPLEAGPGGAGLDEFLVPPLFFPRGNYYIGYSTMFSYYGFTEQLFQTIYVLNTARRFEKTILGFSYKFIRIPENRLYGAEKVRVQEREINISSKEKTLIDLIYFNKPVGGMEEAVRIFKEIIRNRECNLNKLVEFSARFPNITTRKRIGVLLEECGVPDKVLEPLIKSVEKTSVSSLEETRRGILNKKWRVIIDDSSG
jgi:predicted transcriptional regulator of viral defense system